MLELKPVTLDTCREEYCRYASSLRLVDTFWDDMILEAQIYAICDGEVLGYVSHHEKEDLLSSFILLKNGVLRLQEIFSHIRTALHPHGARIVSGDELFLAAAFDHTASIEPKAFFFDLTDKPVKPADYPREWFYEAVETDLPELIETGFYHPAVIGEPENRIFVLRDPSGAFMGTGHIARSPFNRSWGAVGMYTAPAFRQKGAGRSMILFLTEITKEMGLIPICGCAYTNTASKRTLESCGYASRTRYLDLIFKEQA